MGVDSFHTYYVGEAGAWAHNANCAEKVINKEIAIERNIESQLALQKLPLFCGGDFGAHERRDKTD
jgi:hypothetical protein